MSTWLSQAWSCCAFISSLLSTQPEAVASCTAAQKRIPDFIHSSQISTWLRKHGAMQIGPINHLDWPSHFLQAAKAVINIDCWRFPTLLEKLSRLLVEQKLTRTQCRCWSPKAEEWRGPQGTEPQPSMQKPPRDSWCEEGGGKRIAPKAGKISPGNWTVALEDNKTPNVLFRLKLTLHCKGDGVKLLLPSRGVCPLSLSP